MFTFIRKTALSKKEYWYALAILTSIYGIAMCIVISQSENNTYLWGALAGIFAIATYLLGVFAKPSTYGLFVPIFTSILLVMGTLTILFGGGDYIPGQQAIVEKTKDELCALAFTSFGIILPIFLIVITFLLPIFSEQEKKKMKLQ